MLALVFHDRTPVSFFSARLFKTPVSLRLLIRHASIGIFYLGLVGPFPVPHTRAGLAQAAQQYAVGWHGDLLGNLSGPSISAADIV